MKTGRETFPFFFCLPPAHLVSTLNGQGVGIYKKRNFVNAKTNTILEP